MALSSHIDELSERHSQLDRQIELEMTRPLADSLKLTELKRQKLKIKDEIEKLKAKVSQVA